MVPRDSLYPRRPAPAGPPRRRVLGGLAVLALGAAGGAIAVARSGPGAGGPRPFRVLLDAGHGGRDPGAVSRVAPLVEKTVALQVALLTGAALERRGIGVLYTRTDDRHVPLAERAALAARAGAAVLLSLHLNAAADPAVRGTEAWHSGDSAGASLAGAALAGLAPALRDHSLSARGLRQGPWLAVLRGAAPAVLMELGYLTSPVEAPLFARQAFLSRLAEGLADGVQRFRGADPLAPGTADAADAAPAPAATAAPTLYRVQPGDTLGEIARRHGVALPALLAANGVRDPDRVVAGTTLIIPHPGA